MGSAALMKKKKIEEKKAFRIDLKNLKLLKAVIGNTFWL